MNDSQQFKLPDVGEGLTEAEIVGWHVQIGQTVAVNDPLVDIETAKSIVELPSPFAGVVHQLLADAGDTVEVGSPIIVIGSGPADAIDDVTPGSDTAPPTSERPAVDVESPPPPPVSETAAVPQADDPATSADADDKPQVLVGPGPRAAGARRRHLSSAPTPASAARGAAVVPSAVPGPGPVPESTRPPGQVRAKPPVRQLAKRLGVDLHALAQVVTGPISREDVERAAVAPTASPSEAVIASEQPISDGPTLDAGGSMGARETRVPVKGVRKATAQAMTRSAFTAPHVTEWLTVDITPTMELVRRLKADPRWNGVRVNPLLFVARSFLLAVRSFPDINASWDDDAGEIVLKHYVNLGIAAATPRGLLVPNIKDAHTMDVRQLAAALQELVATARDGKTQPADMAQGTVTITNIGALGVDAGTPILNPGESAILAFGAVRQQPWVVDGEIRVREVTQLAMSFDHRLVDGELGSRVLARTGELLSDPSAAFLHA